MTLDIAQDILDILLKRVSDIEGKQFGVHYAKIPSFTTSGIDRRKLHITHTFVGNVIAPSMDEVFRRMQGDVWSPQGEAVPVIEQLELNHTSMSVGDVIVLYGGSNTNRYFVCAPFGWEEINE